MPPLQSATQAALSCPPSRRHWFVCQSVCLSVCPQDNSKCWRRILGDFFGGVQRRRSWGLGSLDPWK